MVSDESLSRPDGGGALMAELGPRIVGIVPDGVATVRVGYEGSGSIDVPVRDNFFSIDAPAATALSANGIPRRPTPTWLDANGNVVGP